MKLIKLIFLSAKKLSILSIILYLFGIHASLAQLSGRMTGGLGAGLSYGGFGAQITYLPLTRIGVFGALGYNLNSIGYNIGAQLKLPTEKRLNWYFTGMYGYNAVLIVKGVINSKTTYYGPSIGTGMVLKFRRYEKSFLSFELLLPLRPRVYHNAIDYLKLIGYDVQKPLPMAFSLGYHFKLF